MFQKGPVFELFSVEKDGKTRFFISDIMSRKTNEISEQGLKFEFIPKNPHNQVFTGVPEKQRIQDTPREHKDNVESPPVKRGRGRPVGSKSKNKSDEQKVKKPRGRPVGSKSKKKD